MSGDYKGFRLQPQALEKSIQGNRSVEYQASVNQMYKASKSLSAISFSFESTAAVKVFSSIFSPSSESSGVGLGSVLPIGLKQMQP